ncbi:type II secretion system protein N [Desulfolithobacter sp.]
MLRVAIRLLVITALLYGAVLFFYTRLEQRMQVPEAALDQGKKQVSAFAAADRGPVPTTDYQLIVQRNIFRAVVNEPLPQKKKDREEPLEPTSLKLELLGTVSGNERDARAIIVDEKEKRQDIYHVGDAVQGAIIERIERGRVILRVGDRKEILLLKDRESKPAPLRNVTGGILIPPPAGDAPVTRRRLPRRGRLVGKPIMVPPIMEREQAVATPDSVFRAEEEGDGAGEERRQEKPPVVMEIQ